MLKKIGKVVIPILLGAMSHAALAKDYGEWTVSESPTYPTAITVNDSGNAFGQGCAEDAEACFWIILSETTSCQDGVQSPTLINASTGSYPLTAICTGTVKIGGTKYHRFVISPFDEVEKVVKESSGIIGLAIPLESGLFTVMRFNLSGSPAALKHLERLANSLFKRLNSSSTKDISL